MQALLVDFAKQVHASEPDTLRYRLHYQADTQEFVLIERYALPSFPSIPSFSQPFFPKRSGNEGRNGECVLMNGFFKKKQV